LTLTQDRYLPLKTAAEILSCTERHIYDLIVEGSLKAIKVGSRAVRVSEQSLNDFIEKNIIKPEDLFDPDLVENSSPAPVSKHTQPVVRAKWMGR